MTRIKLTNTRGRETAAKRRESGVTANYEMRKIIGGILGEEGKDRMYKERGAGRRKKGPAGPDETKTEDKPAGLDGGKTKDKSAGRDGDKIKDVPEGLDVDKDEPAGRDETKKEDKPAGPDGSHYYLLVDPRPGEAPDYDNSALVRCTGTGRSPVHPIDKMDNALYSQHLKDEGATGSNTEAQGAGLGVAVKGRAAGGATSRRSENMQIYRYIWRRVGPPEAGVWP